VLAGIGPILGETAARRQFASVQEYISIFDAYRLTIIAFINTVASAIAIHQEDR
jgi:hypothetical protein